MSVRLAASSYGKDLVRVLRVVRNPSDRASQQVVEYTVRNLLLGAKFEESYTKADNTLVVATDSNKNTINWLAKTLPEDVVLCPEKFALAIAVHFLTKYDHVEGTETTIVQHKWSRIPIDGQPHKHSFVRDGTESRNVFSKVSKGPGGALNVERLEGGVKGLLVLKSSGSAFYGFWRDEFTTLPEVKDRIFSTEVDCVYTLKLPAVPLQELLTSKRDQLPKFCAIYESVVRHTLRLFALDVSASVQATMYRMGKAILTDANNGAVQTVAYALPNKHYIPIDLSWAKINNTSEQTAEVFLPTAHPSGLIKATIARTTAKL